MKDTIAIGRVIEDKLASWAQTATRSAMQDALVLSARPGIISFSLGLPAPELLPNEVFAQACSWVLARKPEALQYSQPSLELKHHIVSLMRTRGVECSHEQVFVTSGAQQGLFLLVTLLLDPGRSVIAEEMCYPGFQNIVASYRPEILTVPSDPHSGMDIDRVEWHLIHSGRPAFIYTIPDGHNPLGVTLSVEKRAKLFALSEKYGVPVIEEDPYGFLSYVTTPLKPIRAQGCDLIFYVGSFSKLLGPSLRLGWLVVPRKLISYLAILKESIDIDTATFSQHLVACVLDSGFLSEHLDRLRSVYKRRRDVLLTALSTFPVGSEWTTPDSGVFVWAQLPHLFDTTRLLDAAVNRYGVSFMPGSAFCVRRDATGARAGLRMNFSYSSESCIKEGMLRLSKLFASAENLGALIA